MAEVFPSTLIHRENPNLRLGIKSSLNSFKQIIASLYAIYTVADFPSDVHYSEEYSDNGTISIRLAHSLKESILSKYAGVVNICDKIENSPLFKSQIEALQVGIELFLRLGKISFAQSSKSERTGKERYEKILSFSDKMMVLDAFLSAFPVGTVNHLLESWLNGQNENSQIENGLKHILSTFIIDCCYKIKRSNGSEIIFNIENVYKELEIGNDVLFKDGETVGPMRVLNSYIDEGMLPDVQKNRSVYTTIEGKSEELKKHISMLSTSLDLIPRSLPYTDAGNKKTTVVYMGECQSPITAYLTALRTKPFMLLAGISGTGKSRIVRKLAQATVTKDLQEADGYKGEDFENDRWTLHSPANFELIQVKPNWHNSMDVIGYLSNIPSPHYVFTPFIEFVVKAWQHPKVPFFLCLDEMNLAPVEEYFAEFLSAIESRSFEDGKYLTDPIIKPFNSFGKAKDEKGEETNVGDMMVNTLFPKFKASDTESDVAKLIKHFRTKGLTLPKNLIVIGTVNMDETTFSFSRKVLDRAMSVEMNEVNYGSFLEDTTDDDIKLIVKAFEEEKYGKGVALNALLVDRHIEAKEVKTELGDNAKFVITYLTNVNALLEGTPFKLGYRAANEALIYLRAAQEFGQADRVAVLDNFTLMKILSRIEGDENKLKITDSEADKERLNKSHVDCEKAKLQGDLNVLTALREIIVQQLGEYYKIEAEENPEEGDEQNDKTAEGEQVSEAALQAPKEEHGEKLKSIKKIDNMLSQLKRDHFVSYWN